MSLPPPEARPHILFCTAVSPFRNRFGEQIRSKNIIRSLLGLGCKVTLLANKEEGGIPDIPAGAVNLLSYDESYLRRPKSIALVSQLFVKNRRFLAASNVVM